MGVSLSSMFFSLSPSTYLSLKKKIKNQEHSGAATALLQASVSAAASSFIQPLSTRTRGEQKGAPSPVRGGRGTWSHPHLVCVGVRLEGPGTPNPARASRGWVCAETGVSRK